MAFYRYIHSDTDITVQCYAKGPPPAKNTSGPALEISPCPCAAFQTASLGRSDVAIDAGQISPNDTNLNESDLAAGFGIRASRSELNLGAGLRTSNSLREGSLRGGLRQLR